MGAISILIFIGIGMWEVGTGRKTTLVPLNITNFVQEKITRTLSVFSIFQGQEKHRSYSCAKHFLCFYQYVVKNFPCPHWN